MYLCFICPCRSLKIELIPLIAQQGLCEVLETPGWTKPDWFSLPLEGDFHLVGDADLNQTPVWLNTVARLVWGLRGKTGDQESFQSETWLCDCVWAIRTRCPWGTGVPAERGRIIEARKKVKESDYHEQRTWQRLVWLEWREERW